MFKIGDKVWIAYKSWLSEMDRYIEAEILDIITNTDKTDEIKEQVSPLYKIKLNQDIPCDYDNDNNNYVMHNVVHNSRLDIEFIHNNIFICGAIAYDILTS